ncbi:hypothetical protein AXG93_645s1050 [Marchantia polymorpha subsp. ruderalis]|uniref:Uncharacterized protein n=1 Tax=Marchantia polymorpha subsp. ruderalis TaxID=1480154 RepID=A0A176WSY9_MARPO|nr:hypothetical protein AXG93_645s1050 [Marchantia polymorpha subsp. ruderalis]
MGNPKFFDGIHISGVKHFIVWPSSTEQTSAAFKIYIDHKKLSFHRLIDCPVHTVFYTQSIQELAELQALHVQLTGSSCLSYEWITEAQGSLENCTHDQIDDSVSSLGSVLLLALPRCGGEGWEGEAHYYSRSNLSTALTELIVVYMAALTLQCCFLGTLTGLGYRMCTNDAGACEYFWFTWTSHKTSSYSPTGLRRSEERVIDAFELEHQSLAGQSRPNNGICVH